MEINKYQKKPISVEAVEFNDKNKNSVFSWAKEIQGNVYPDHDEDSKPILIVPTLEGDMVCGLGDFLIKEPFPTNDRRLYPCKSTIFHQTYQRLRF